MQGEKTARALAASLVVTRQKATPDLVPSVLLFADRGSSDTRQRRRPSGTLRIPAPLDGGSMSRLLTRAPCAGCSCLAPRGGSRPSLDLRLCAAAVCLAQRRDRRWRLRPGIIFNQTEQDLIYARTDIGGAYRWTSNVDPAARLGGLHDWGLPASQPGDRSGRPQPRLRRWPACTRTACDPEQRRDPALPRSRQLVDRIDLPFKLGGNMPGRGMGERLAIDPNLNSILYLGTRSRQRPLAEHRLRRDLGQGDQLSRSRQLRPGSPTIPTDTSSDTRASSG